MYTKRITLNTRGEKWKVKKQVDNCRWFLFLLQYCCDPWRSFFHQCVAQKLLDKDPPNSDSLFSFFFFYLLLFFLGFTPVLVHWWRVFFLFLIESYSERICLYKIPALGFGPPSPWASASTLCWSKCSVIQTEGRLEGFVCAYVCWILPVDESLLYVSPPLSLSQGCVYYFVSLLFELTLLVFCSLYFTVVGLIWFDLLAGTVILVREKVEDTAHCLDLLYWTG